jgi:hypothetical protein
VTSRAGWDFSKEPQRQPDIVTPDQKILAAFGDDGRALLSVLDWTVGLALVSARERFRGLEYDRLARAEILLHDAVSFRIEHARRGRL